MMRVFATFQPIFDLASQKLAGLESLARIRVDPQRPPNEWFSEAKEAALSTELELAAVRGAVRALPLLATDLYLSVKCSPATALSGELQELLHTTDVARLVLEITEHEHIEAYPALAVAADREFASRPRSAPRP